MLERAVEDGVKEFDRVKRSIESFVERYQTVVDRYEITANPGIAVNGYYIALNSKMGAISWDRLELPESYEDVPVAVRKRR